MNKIFIFLIILITATRLSAQRLTGVSVRQEGSFGEWTLYTDVEEEEGTLECTWRLQNRWNMWNYHLRHRNGTIRTAWEERFEDWELRGSGKTVTMQQVWRNDMREWRLHDGAISIDFRVRRREDWFEWMMEDERYGVFYMVSTHPNDPRDWTIQDDTNEQVSLPLRLAMVFIALQVTAPKY